MLAYILIAVSVICAIFLIVGLFKGYAKLSFWGGTVIGTVFISRLATMWIPEDNAYAGLISLGVALGVMLLLSFLFQRVKKYIVRAVAASEKLSDYRNHDERAENEEQILVALDKKDKKTYRKLSKRKFRKSRGPWGVVDRVFGGITYAVNAATVLAIICCVAFVVVDMLTFNASGSGIVWIETIESAFTGIIDAAFWTDFGAKYALDLIVVTLMCVCVRSGYKGGLLSSLGALLVLALLVGSGFIAYSLSFKAPAFISLAENLTTGAFAGLIANIQEVLDAMQIEPVVISQIVLTVGLFLLFLIPVIIIGIFIPRVVEAIRNTKIAAAADGACGAAVAFALVFAVLMFIGALIYQVNDLAVLERFNSYMENSAVANCLYNNNVFSQLSFIAELPLRAWFGLE